VFARLSRSASLVAVASVLVLASACGGETTSGNTASTPADQTPSPTQRAALTKAQLTAALLTVKDLPPAGFKATKSSESSTVTGDPACLKMDKIDVAVEKGTQPQLAASANVEFETADQTGGADEVLASFQDEAAAEKLFDEYAAAADDCRSLGLELDPTTTLKLTGAPLPVPKTGDASRAFRYRGTLQGTKFQMDAILLRVDGTLAWLSIGRFGGAIATGAVEGMANNAANNLQAAAAS
jgi:hypothetical protein